MSRFDYPDPGLDPAYCDGLAPDQAQPDTGKPCPVCPAIAWKMSDGPDGLAHYMCRAGHVLIVAPTSWEGDA